MLLCMQTCVCTPADVVASWRSVLSNHFTHYFLCVYCPSVPPHTQLFFMSMVFTQLRLKLHNYASEKFWFLGLSHVKDTTGMSLKLSWSSVWPLCSWERYCTKVILAGLLTHLLSSCCCSLSSVVSAALKRPPQVPLHCSLSPSGSFTPPASSSSSFSASCSLFSVVGGVVPRPEATRKGSTAACRVGKRAWEMNRSIHPESLNDCTGLKSNRGIKWSGSQQHQWLTDFATIAVWWCSCFFYSSYLVRGEAKHHVSQSCLIVLEVHLLWATLVVQMSRVHAGNNIIVFSRSFFSERNCTRLPHPKWLGTTEYVLCTSLCASVYLNLELLYHCSL